MHARADSRLQCSLRTLCASAHSRGLLTLSFRYFRYLRYIHEILNQTNVEKGILVNRTCHSINRRSFEIKLTVPLISAFVISRDIIKFKEKDVRFTTKGPLNRFPS